MVGEDEDLVQFYCTK